MNPSESAGKKLALTLHDIGAVRLGQFKLRSGQMSPIYLDLRLLVSYPRALRQATAVYRAILQELVFDRLAATPLAGLPIGTAVALDMDRPLIYPRPQAKEHGTGKMIEGEWEAGETAVVLDDLITAGGSLCQAAQTLRDAGLNVRDAVVLIDREQGGGRALQARGLRLHAGMTLSQILTILEETKRISAAQRTAVTDALQLP